MRALSLGIVLAMATTAMASPERIVRRAVPAVRKLGTRHQVHVGLETCGKASAYYDSRHHAIRMCRELYDDLLATLGDERSADGAFVFALLHEVAHALISERALPVPGNEEAAADELATLLLSRLGARGEAAAQAMARYFDALARRTTARDYTNEHPVFEQRVAAITCSLEGAHLRDRRCAVQYWTHLRAWSTLLAGS